MKPSWPEKIVITGAAGMLGRNLLRLLEDEAQRRCERLPTIVALDKHPTNVERLREAHPGIEVIAADLSEPGPWQDRFSDAQIVVQLHAHLGSEVPDDYVRDNVRATERVIEACRRAGSPFLIHISSSVINSMAQDHYVNTKVRQEELVRQSSLAHCVLRPTLMFGWYDRKHLGWLSRFMKKVPVFPVPGHGRYMRQPLYAVDFCQVMLRCIERRPEGAVHDITGRDRIDFIDLMRKIRDACGLRTPIIRLPYRLFWWILWTYARVDRHPPFTTDQLEALVTPDDFPLIPWWDIYGVEPTPLDEAMRATFATSAGEGEALDF